MKRKHLTILAISALVVGACAGVAALFTGAGLLAYWRAPLGPSLDLPTRTLPALAVNTPAPAGTATLQPTRTPFPTSNIPLAGTATPFQITCGGPPVMNLLAVGSDVRGDNYTYGLADAIRIVRVDFITPRVTILEFPRDLYVQIPGIADHYGITHGKINQAYLYGQPGFSYYDGPGGGPGLLARTLELNFGMRVDHYGVVNMQTFVRIVDAVGGIDVVLDRYINGNAPDSDPPKKELIFTAGYHHLNGKQALILARLRPYGGFERAESQNLVLCALRDKLLSASVITRIPDLIKSFENSVLTDLSPEQISQLACLAPHLSGDNLVFARFPEELFTGTRVDDPVLGYTSILEADFNVLRDYVTEFEAGVWPSIVPGASVPPEKSSSSLCP
ncbi:MAG: LCP family protein [Chloroflexota bacterium]